MRLAWHSSSQTSSAHPCHILCRYRLDPVEQLHSTGQKFWRGIPTASGRGIVLPINILHQLTTCMEEAVRASLFDILPSLL